MTSGIDTPLFGVWGRSECEVYAVGESGTILRYAPVVGDDDDDDDSSDASAQRVSS
jgi:hypothetical protein